MTDDTTLEAAVDCFTPLRIRVKRLYLDRGFYSVPVIHWLKALNIPFVMPAIIRGKTGGTRQLLVGRKSYATRYSLQSCSGGSKVDK